MMKLRVILSCLAAVTVAGIAHAETKEVTVKARPEGGFWTDTGIYVSTGDQITVRAIEGSWSPNPNWGSVGAAGNINYTAGMEYLVAGSPEGALVGKIGGEKGWSDRGKKNFMIGEMRSIPTDIEGTLWLSVNDAEQGLGDNSGEIKVRITFN